VFRTFDALLHYIFRGNTSTTNSCIASDHQKTGSFHPLNYVNLHFLDTAWRQLNTEIICKPWQIAGCDCRQLYQISNWCVHQNSLIRHTEKLTQSNLFCFNRLIKPTAKFFCCFVYTQKKSLRFNFTFLLRCLYCKLKNKNGVRWNHSGLGLQRRSNLKALLYDIFSCCIENCTINNLTSLNAKGIFTSDDVIERQSSPALLTVPYFFLFFQL